MRVLQQIEWHNVTQPPISCGQPPCGERRRSHDNALAPEFEIAAERARLRAGRSQSELAARMGTSQSIIARLESGQTLPSTKTLTRRSETLSYKIANWRTAADEDGQYRFAVAL
jgi:ribosome-binding protein aMBF1 (putative translation factor)